MFNNMKSIDYVICFVIAIIAGPIVLSPFIKDTTTIYNLILALYTIFVVITIIYFRKRPKFDSKDIINTDIIVNQDDSQEEQEAIMNKEQIYTKKNFLTYTEKNFYQIFKSILGDEYIIIPQINLATIINKNNQFRWQNELYRNIDFGIFSKELELLLLIEINDKSHRTYERKKRDRNVEKLCAEAGYEVLRFWTDKPNKYYYIKNRILKHLNTVNNQPKE